MKALCSIAAFCFAVSVLQAQLVLKPGAVWTSMPESELALRADLVLDSGAFWVERGTLYLQDDWINRGRFDHEGVLVQEGDVAQSGQLNCMSGSVWLMMGGVQQLSGDSAIAFDRWLNTGSGTRQMGRDVSTRELALDSVRIFTGSSNLDVHSSSSTAVYNVAGWVISDTGGAFQRAMWADTIYRFPVGSASQYRPVSIQPSFSGNAGLRFSALSAAAEGYPLFLNDASICALNAQGHYRMESEVPVRFSAAWPSDGFNYAGMAERNEATGGAWNSVPSVVATLGTDSVSVSGLLPPETRRIQLYRARPQTPVILGDSAFCQGHQDAVFRIDPIAGATSVWNVTGGIPSQTSDTQLAVNWSNSSTGQVGVFVSYADGCSSLAAQLPVTLFPNPEAAITMSTPEWPFAGATWAFAQSGFGVAQQYWDFGNGNAASDSLVYQHFPEPGQYAVQLVVVSVDGCRDTAVTAVESLEGVVFPQAFSPNGDGVNDVWELKNGGLDRFLLRVFDRWGNLVFENDKPGYYWDGRTLSGEMVPDGTYYYVLDAAGEQAQYSKRSFVQVFR